MDSTKLLRELLLVSSRNNIVHFNMIGPNFLCEVIVYEITWWCKH